RARQARRIRPTPYGDLDRRDAGSVQPVRKALRRQPERIRRASFADTAEREDEREKAQRNRHEHPRVLAVVEIAFERLSKIGDAERTRHARVEQAPRLALQLSDLARERDQLGQVRIDLLRSRDELLGDLVPVERAYAFEGDVATHDSS